MLKQIEQEAWDDYKKAEADHYDKKYVTMLCSEWIGIRTVVIRLGLMGE